jgi:hypothetical protein
MKVLLTGAAGLIGMAWRPILASRATRSSPPISLPSAAPIPNSG